MSQQFRTVDVLRLEIESDPEGLSNLIQNPSGDLGGWGWVTPVDDSYLESVAGPSLSLRAPTTVQPVHFTSEAVAVAGDDYVAARIEGSDGIGFFRLRFEWLDSMRALLSSSVQTAYFAADAGAVSLGPIQAPSAATFARLRVDLYSDLSAGDPAGAGVELLRFADVTLATAETAGALGTTRINRSANPSFETDVVGWVPAGSTTLTRVTSPAGSQGAACLQVQNTAATGTTRTNRVVNPSFETDAANWTGYVAWGGANLSRFTATSRVGSASLLFDALGGSKRAAVRTNGGTGGMPVNPRTSYQMRFSVRLGNNYTALNRIFARVAFYDAAGNYLSTGVDEQAIYPAAQNLTTSAWHDLVLTQDTTAPSGAAFARVAVVATRDDGSDLGAGVNAWLDRVSLIAGGGDYFDGNTAGSTAGNVTRSYAWAGTAGASASIETTTTSLPSTDDGAQTVASVLGGRDYTLSAYFRTAASPAALNWQVEWLDESDDPIDSITHNIGEDSTDWQRFGLTVTSPSAAASLRWSLTYAALDPGEIHYIDGVLIEQAGEVGTWFAGTLFNATLDYIEPIPHRNILGPSHDVRISREALNTGTLTATVLDVELDPSTSDLIRPGRRIRLLNLVGNLWRPLFTGKVASAKVTYHHKTRRDRTARIEVTAVDNLAALSNQKRGDGVATIDDLPYVLEGCGVPWNVNGSGGQVPTATVVARNDSASAADQVAITRDSVLGYAWVDRYGTVQAWDRSALATLPASVQNFLTANQSSVELSTSDWSFVSAFNAYDHGFSVRQSTDRAVHGKHSAKVNLSTTSKGNECVTLTQGLVPGKEYTFRGQVWVPSGCPDVRADVTFYGAGPYTSLKDQWVTLEATFIMPPTGAALAGFTSKPSTAGQFYYFDACSLTTPNSLPENRYSEIDIDFDTERAINEVTINFLRYDPTTGDTEEVPYGPYRDEPSITKWGVRASEFTIQGLAEEVADIEAFADAVLLANAIPTRTVNSVTIPVATTGDVAAAGYDLYDLVQVSNTRAGIDAASRVTRIEHTITPDKWLIILGFDTEGSVAAPTFVPSPEIGAGGKTIGQLLRPVGEMTMFFGDVPDGWLECDGSTFSDTDFPRLAEFLGGTTLPNLIDRFPIGAGTKALGTSGGSPTTTIATSNLPAHNHLGQWANDPGTNTTHYARGDSSGPTGTNPNVVQNGDFANNPLDVLNPWRAVRFAIRAV